MSVYPLYLVLGKDGEIGAYDREDILKADLHVHAGLGYPARAVFRLNQRTLSVTYERIHDYAEWTVPQENLCSKHLYASLLPEFQTSDKCQECGAGDNPTNQVSGDYGDGPDVSSGFTSYAIVDKEGRCVVDTLNSAVAIVWEEVDEDGLTAWDEQGRIDAGFIVRCVNNHGPLLEALREAKDLIKIWHGDEAWEVYDAHSPEMIRINRTLALAEKGSE